MTVRTSSLFALLLAATFGVAACDSDPKLRNTGDPLDADEAVGILEILVLVGLSYPVSGSEIEAEDGPFDGVVDAVLNCEEGVVSIDVAYEGTYDQESEEGTFEADGNLNFLGCLIASFGSVALILDGDPDVDVDLEVEIDGEPVRYEASFDGGIEFETEDERSGRCAVDFSIVLDASGEETTVDLTGTLCGVPGSEFEPFFVS